MPHVSFALFGVVGFLAGLAKRSRQAQFSFDEIQAGLLRVQAGLLRVGSIPLELIAHCPYHPELDKQRRTDLQAVAIPKCAKHTKRLSLVFSWAITGNRYYSEIAYTSPWRSRKADPWMSLSEWLDGVNIRTEAVRSAI
jgi:hypothetical protein